MAMVTGWQKSYLKSVNYIYPIKLRISDLKHSADTFSVMPAKGFDIGSNIYS
jgi:hypothetical protein